MMAIEDDAHAAEYAHLIASGESLRRIGESEFSHSQLEAVVDGLKRVATTLPGDEQIQRHLHSLDREELAAYAEQLTCRLKKETTVLDDLHAEGLDPFVHDLREVTVPFTVKYVSPEEIQAMSRFPKRTSACYRGGTIFIGGELPQLRDRLATFATRGILANDLFHEVYHGFQDDELRFATMEELLDYLASPHTAEWKLALAESHAWMTCLPGFKDEVLIPVILENYGIEGRHYLEAAFEVIRALHALDVTDREIGKLISQARWDEEAKSYTVLMEEIDRLVKLHGHAPEELDALIERHKLVQRIQVLRGMAIAAELCEGRPSPSS